MSAEQEMVNASTNLLTEEQRKHLERRQTRTNVEVQGGETIQTNEPGPGPSRNKGKGRDLGNWSNSGLVSEELNRHQGDVRRVRKGPKRCNEYWQLEGTQKQER